MTDLSYLSATNAVAQIKSGKLSSEALLNHSFERIDQLNPQINAIVTEQRELALEQARAADCAVVAGEDWGPLHGLPMSVKESFDVTGLATTWGLPQKKNNIAASDAVAVERLKSNGAIVFGKTNVPLLLGDFQSFNEIYGITNNPWDQARSPGGSSGGAAAALAAGFVSLELGSDIGGSIRNPAHYCGVFGHKPSWGLIPQRGHGMPGILSETDLAVIGPLARTAQDLKLAFELLCGPDELEAARYQKNLSPATQTHLGEFRVAVLSQHENSPVSAETVTRVQQLVTVFSDAGAQVKADFAPGFSIAEADAIYQQMLQSTIAATVSDGLFTKLCDKAKRLSESDQNPKAQQLRAQTMYYRDWHRLNEARAHIRWAWHQYFKNVDLLIAPVMPTAAFEHDHTPFSKRKIEVDGTLQSYGQQIFWSGLASLSYLPSTVIPTGVNAQGLPIGLQLIGPAFGDLTTLKAAQLLEQVGFAFAPPPGF